MSGKWLKSPQNLLFEVRDHVAYVTLNRPEKRNALSITLFQELHDAMQEADDLNEVRCVVLAGNGKDFCAGADIAGGPVNTVTKSDYDPSLYRARDDSYGAQNSFENDLWLLKLSSQSRLIIHNMHKPVIAKIHGNCLAAGSDIALTCDLLIAATDARIGFPAARAVGSPANHMWLYLVGPQWAKRMLMTGDVISGADAARIGLVLDAYPREQLDAEVDRIAKRIALMPTDLLVTHKRIVNLGLEIMGWDTMQTLAAENDARAHLSSAFTKFFKTAREKGFQTALAERDGPYGDLTGDTRADSLVKLNILSAAPKL